MPRLNSSEIHMIEAEYNSWKEPILFEPLTELGEYIGALDSAGVALSRCVREAVILGILDFDMTMRDVYRWLEDYLNARYRAVLLPSAGVFATRVEAIASGHLDGVYYPDLGGFIAIEFEE